MGIFLCPLIAEGARDTGLFIRTLIPLRKLSLHSLILSLTRKSPPNSASLGVPISMPLREHRSQPSFRSHLSFPVSFPGSVPDDGIQGVFPTFQQHANSFVPKHQRNDFVCPARTHRGHSIKSSFRKELWRRGMKTARARVRRPRSVKGTDLTPS